jgi:hypothetical protein
MNRIIGLFTVFLVAFPLASIAGSLPSAGPPPGLMQQMRACGVTTSYDAWVTAGMPCNKGGGSSTGISPAGTLGGILGTLIGNEIAKSIRGNPEEDARRAEEAQALAAKAAEDKRRTEEQLRKQQEELLKQQEEKKNRLLGNMMGVGSPSKLGLMGVDSGPGLKLMTGEQAEPPPTLDEYKAWEKYKRDVLAYQALVTKNNPKNMENQRWCESRVPLSTGPNRANWEARCNPDGRVGGTDNVAVPPPKVETAAAPVPVAAKPALKDPAAALAGSDEQAKTAAQGGFDSKGPMLGKPGDVPKIPETTPVGEPPVAAAPTLKDPAPAPAGSDGQAKTAAQGGSDAKDPMPGTPGDVPKISGTVPAPAARAAKAMPALKDPGAALAGSDEQVKTAAQGGFDTKGPMLGRQGAVPKVSVKFPVGAAPVAAAAPAMIAAIDARAIVPVPVKGTTSQVERQSMIGETPLLLNQGNPEHIARGNRYVDCDDTRTLYERMSAGLPVQKDWLVRTKAQLDSAAKESKAISKEQEEFFIKSAYDTARALMLNMDILRMRIQKMKMDGIPLDQRKAWMKTMKSFNDTYDRLDKGMKLFVEGKDFGKDFHVAGKDAMDVASELGIFLDKSGIGDEGIQRLAHLLGPTGEIAITGGKLFFDAGILIWKNNMNEAELAQAQATYDTLHYNYDRAQEKVDNAKSDLDTFCGGKTRTVAAATKVPVKVPVPPKETPPRVERQPMARKQAEPTPAPAPKETSTTPFQKAVAEKQTQALSCATREFEELSNGMGEEGARLRAELKTFLDDVRVELSKPCSGQPKTHNIQTAFLSGLTKNAKKKDDNLEGSLLMTRDEETCEVRLDVLHASSLKSASSSRIFGKSFNEGQRIMHIDKAGNILAAETPSDVEKCMARLSAKEQ